MSTIVAYRCPKSGEVWIGSDTRSTSEGVIWPVVSNKWISVGRSRIGVVGHALTVQIIRAGASELAEFIEVKPISDWLIDKLRVAGYQSTRKAEEAGAPNYGQGFLLASAEGVWSIGGDGKI